MLSETKRELVSITSKRGQRIPQELLDDIAKEHKFYREDQTRDDHGRFADEGGKFRNDPETYSREQVKDIPKGKSGLSHEKLEGGQPSVVYRDKKGKAVGVLRHTGKALTDIAVLPENRGQGIGSQMIEAAKSKGVTSARAPFSKHGLELVKKGGLTLVDHHDRELTEEEATEGQDKPQRTGARGIWDSTFVGAGTEQRHKLAKELGADPNKHFYEQSPKIQKAITDHFIKKGEAQYRAVIDNLFDAESGKTQDRDKGGRFADEGKGSTASGYQHPSDVDISAKDGKVKAHEEEHGRRVSGRTFGVDSDTDREAFSGAIRKTHEEHAFGAAVAVKDPQFYQDKHTKLFLSEDRLAGLAVSPDGDLVSGFKHPKSKANFDELLDEASPLSTHLDAFASGNGHLPELYAKHGFKPIARVKFDRKYAPEGWDYDKHGEPDVVFMVRDPDNKLKLPDVSAKGYKAVEKDIPVVKGFDEARAKQLEAVSKVSGSDITGLDKALVDYKPDRSLSDPSKTVRIDKLVPDVSYTPYSKTPFFHRVNVLQGSIDPLHYGVGDYIKQRDLLFDTVPVTKMALDNVVVTQPLVNKDRVQQIIDKPETGGTKAIQAVKYGGKTYILNGHHRVAADLKEGKKEINAHLLDLDHPDPAPPKTEADVPRYLKELATTPEFRSVEDRLNSTGATNGEREGWSMRQNTTDGSMNPDKLTPERKALHEEIIKSFLNPKAVAKPGEKPKAIYLIGKPAAGKTFSSGDLLKDYGEVTTIGADLIREKLPEYRGWNTPATQEEAKVIAGEIVKRALAARQSIVFDEVGSNFAKLETRTKKLASPEGGGYEIDVIHVDAPMEQSAKLTWDRFREGGRFTDPSYLLNDVDHRPDNTYNKLKKMPEVKKWDAFDNKDFKRKLVDHGSR